MPECELWASGWMHNRVRMIAASFLIKHLLIDWRRGERWFWDTLVDADYAQNAVNWQWSAGSGVDANQFTRIMAPLTQSPKFDAGIISAAGCPNWPRWAKRRSTIRPLRGHAAPIHADRGACRGAGEGLGAYAMIKGVEGKCEGVTPSRSACLRCAPCHLASLAPQV
jgi:hypothetical protein